MIVFNGRKYQYIKPYYLLEEGSVKLIKGYVIGSTLGWKIDGRFLSYNKLKKQK